MAEIFYKWRPIEDLPENWQDLCSDELNSLANIWVEEARKLQEDSALREFNAKLCREWSIETGIIEGLYDISAGVTVTLIQQGLDASYIPFDAADRPADEIIPTLRNHHEAIDGLFDFVKNERELSVSYIKQLHQVLTAHQAKVDAINGMGRTTTTSLLRGEWKKQPNNPTRPDGEVHEYCPSEQVASEMEKLVSLHLRHMERGVFPEVEAAWLHHRFTQIHPFMDGNGRVARCLATLVFLRKRLFPLVVRRGTRAKYIEALEKADFGNLQELVNLFVDLQKDSLVKALSLSRETRGLLGDIFKSAAQKLRRKKIKEQRKMETAIVFAEKLRKISARRLDDVAKEARAVLQEVDPDFYAHAESSNEQNSHYFRWQIIQTAQKLGYYANMRSFRAWSRLILKGESRFDFLVSFHALGIEYTGVMASNAMTFNREPRGDEEGFDFVNLKSASETVFQYTYLEEFAKVERRFKEWLETAITIALDRWHKGF